VKKTIQSLIVHPVLLFILLAAFSLQFSSCNKIDVFEKDTTIPQYEWQYSFVPSYQFNITDTISKYHVYVVLRHTDAYRYNNLWLNIGFKAPTDSLRNVQFEFTLGNDATGWEGTGMDDIWEVRKLVTNGPQEYFTFKKPGEYKFTLAQAMRENPLRNIMDAGIRVEKVKENN
jgi:gliding motility-associated lipoprotein GldH